MVHGFFGMGNIGDEAILASAVALLKERLVEPEIMVLSHAPRETEQLHPVMAIDRQDLHGQSLALSQADVLLFGGGGLCNDYWQGPPANVFDDGWGGLPYYLRLPLLAGLHAVPVVAYAQGVGPLASAAARRMVRFVFDQAADISVRDRRSAELLGELGVTSSIDISADPAFVLEANQCEAATALQAIGVGIDSSPLVGVSVRPFAPFTPGRIRELAQAVSRFTTRINGQVVLLPFCYKGNSADLETCKSFRAALTPDVRCTILEAELSPGGMLATVAQMDLVIATRYHAGLFALRSGVPFLGVSYDPKMDSLVEESAIEQIRGLSLAHLSPDSVVPLLTELWENRESLRPRLAQVTAARQQQVQATMDRVSGLIAASHRKMSSSPDRRSKPLWAPQPGSKSVRSLLNEVREESQRSTNQIEELAAQLQQKNLQIESLQFRLQGADRLKERLVGLEAELCSWRSQAAEAATRLSVLEHSYQAELNQSYKRFSEAVSRTAELEQKRQAESDHSNNRIAEALAKAADLEKKRQAAEDKIKQKDKLLAELESGNQQLKKKLAFAQERYRSTAEQLQEVCESRGLQFINRFYNTRSIGGAWRLLKRVAPTGVKQYIKRRLFPHEVTTVVEMPVPAPATRSAPSTPARSAASTPVRSAATTQAAVASPPAANKPRTKAEVIDDLESFLERVDQSHARDLLVFVAGVKYIENEGQRVTQIIRALTDAGQPVLLIYFRWRAEYNQEVPRSKNSMFFQVPIDIFEPQRNLLIGYPFRSSLRRACVFEFPFPPAFQWVNEFNLTGWKTAYDIIDDWEEFHAAGKAIWYEEAVEQYFCGNASVVTAIVPLLAEKAQQWVPGLDVTMVPNGVSPNSFDMTLPPKPLKRGKLTVGYFGYLTPAWFDWEMVATVAARRPDWEFHIVGYGEPVPVELSANVQLLGKVNHHELYAYTQNWDVAIVPFKPTTLSRGADPIKVYEYLTLGLPVVSTDIPHLRSYPNVYVASSTDEFEQLLVRAARERLPSSEVQSFLKSCTWYQRGIDLIEAAQAGRGELLTAAAREVNG